MAIVPGDKSLPLLVSLLNHILCKGFVFRLVIEGKLVDRLAIWNLKAENKIVVKFRQTSWLLETPLTMSVLHSIANNYHTL